MFFVCLFRNKISSSCDLHIQPRRFLQADWMNTVRLCICQQRPEQYFTFFIFKLLPLAAVETAATTVLYPIRAEHTYRVRMCALITINWLRNVKRHWRCCIACHSACITQHATSLRAQNQIHSGTISCVIAAEWITCHCKTIEFV